MNTRDEMTGESAADSTWFGLDRLRLDDESGSVIVTVGSPSRWDRTHLRRLRQSADLPGLVPIIDADTSSDGKAYAVTPAVDAPTLADLLESGETGWQSRAGITEATARAAHEAHMRGLFHGALDPSQIRVLGNDVAVEGIGLGLGGTPESDQEQWAAPEVRNQGEVTERSDVYSLGKVLEASLGDSAEEAPRSVRRLIMWSTSDTPEARPPSALEFASILAEAMGEDRETYNPAFIPTSDLADLASTAPQAVAAHTPADPASRGVGGAAVAGAAAAGAAAIGAASLLGDDEEIGDAIEVVDEPEIDEVDASVDEPDPEPEPEELFDEAVETSDIDAGAAAAVGTATTEISEADLAAAADDDIDGIDTSDFEVPAAARTIDIPDATEERRGNRAGILVGAILAAGLGLVAFQLLNSNDDDPADTEAADSAEDSGDAAATDGDDDATAQEADDTATTDGDDDATAEEADDTSANAGDDDATAEEGDDTATTDGDDDATAEEGDDTATTDGDDDATAEEGDDTSANAGDDATTDDSDDATSSETDEGDNATSGEGEGDDATSESDDTEGEGEGDDATGAESDSSGESAVATSGPAIVGGAIAADDAGVQLLHGIPGVDVDVYLNGEALAPGFAPNTVAGPANLAPGTYDVAIYAASDNPPAQAADRTDDPVIAETVTVGSDPVTLAAHLDGGGVPTLSGFEEDLTTLAPGKSRIEVRHLAAAPAVELTVDGGSATPVEPGRAESFVLDAGSHVIEASTADGTPVKTATVVVDDGELAAVSLIGSADGGIEIAVQRYTGLSSAPGGVPTGDSNLLGQADDQTGLFLLGGLAALMAAAGALIMTRRSRRVL